MLKPLQRAGRRYKGRHKKGMEEDVEKGKKSEKIAIAKNLKNSGIDINIISENTGLSIEEIKNL